MMYLVTKRDAQIGPPHTEGPIWEIQCGNCSRRFDVQSEHTDVAECPVCQERERLTDVKDTRPYVNGRPRASQALDPGSSPGGRSPLKVTISKLPGKFERATIELPVTCPECHRDVTPKNVEAIYYVRGAYSGLVKENCEFEAEDLVSDMPRGLELGPHPTGYRCEACGADLPSEAP